MTEEQLADLLGRPVEVLVTPKPPGGRHAVLIREDRTFLKPEGASAESLYAKADVDALVAEVRKLRVISDAVEKWYLAKTPEDARWALEYLRVHVADARKALEGGACKHEWRVDMIATGDGTPVEARFCRVCGAHENVVMEGGA